MTKIDRKQEAGSQKNKRPATAMQPRVLTDDRYFRPLILLLLALLLTLIIIPKGGFVPDYYAPGDIAAGDVKAPRDLLVPDLPLTEKKRVEAEEAILPLYDFAPRAGQDLAERLVQAIKLLDAEGKKGASPKDLREKVESLLGFAVSDEDLTALAGLPAADPFPGVLRAALLQALNGKIVGNLSLFKTDRERGIIIRDLATQQEVEVKEPADVIGLEAAQKRVADQLKQLEEIPPNSRKILLGIIEKLVRPNLTFNTNETEARKQQAREAVKPVLFQVKKGEMIVRVGERVTEDQVKKLKAMSDLRNDYSTLRTATGMLIVILLLLLATHRYANRNIRKYRIQNRDLIFLTTTFVGLLALVKLAIFISTALESAFPYIDSASYYYIFPFAVGAMLVRIVLNSEIAFVFALLSSLLLGILFGNSLFIALYALAGSLTGAHWVRQCKQRTTLYRAGFRLSMVNVLLIIGMHLMAGRPFDLQLLYKFAFGLGGGFVCAVIVTGTIPLVEAAFKYTTDIKLLELANMNTPVLRELMIQAPGTYHHSIIVGNLVEAAAESINANPLLTRVAAYYHDIGKIRKPLYFVENLGNQDNRHEKLAPSMSALILMAHVKDGVEIARENKLGETLVDILRQHHGTALIKFFYDKAKTKEDPGMSPVDERDYRYPGPKPQTREAALIMLADAVEAASRTLTDPTAARIQGMVQKIINNIFIDGQLDECELTLKDLHNIAKSFNRILAGIFHHRIDYPEPVHKEREKEPARRKNGEDTHRESAKESKGKDADPEKGSTEDLKRLGMS
ncbi:HD family phosphohydrolase [Desulfuromonas sp. TF]|uniref:HD family phosphohydrolase n=1 Tax=Desulfuromonas sp. TF TaxID=1232410 RepID=UPI00041BBBDE|nr:HDIG domain-containing metalloprotein [Desulfuromonas sp. TF]